MNRSFSENGSLLFSCPETFISFEMSHSVTVLERSDPMVIFSRSHGPTMRRMTVLLPSVYLKICLS